MGARTEIGGATKTHDPCVSRFLREAVLRDGLLSFLATPASAKCLPRSIPPPDLCPGWSPAMAQRARPLQRTCRRWRHRCCCSGRHNTSSRRTKMAARSGRRACIPAFRPLPSPTKRLWCMPLDSAWPSTAIANGSSTQSLPSFPVCQIGTSAAPVAFAGRMVPLGSIRSTLARTAYPAHHSAI